MRATTVLALILIPLGACSSARGVPDGLMESCETNADCADGFECLPWLDPYTEADVVIGEEDTGVDFICSLPCSSVDECPEITSGHCGELTVCAAGACGYRACY